MIISIIAYAMLLTVALTACSDADDSVSSLALSEQNDRFFLDNITVEGHASRHLSASAAVNSTTLKRVADAGPIVRMAELDSITLDTTGVVFYSHCDGSTGEFAFDHVSLRGPYVKIELAPYAESDSLQWNGSWTFDMYDQAQDRFMATYSVIVDLRKSRTVNINVMTFLETSRLQRLVRLGRGLVEAKERADKEIMSAVGLSGEHFDFDKPEFAQNQGHLIVNNLLEDLVLEWSASASPWQVANVFGNMGSLSTNNPVSEFFIDELKAWKRQKPDDDSAIVFINRLLEALQGQRK
jgi:hypothetical protein